MKAKIATEAAKEPLPDVAFRKAFKSRFDRSPIQWRKSQGK